MSKKTSKKSTKQQSAETAAQPYGRAAKIDETAAERAKTPKSPAPAVTAKPSTAPAGLPMQPLRPLAASKPFQSPAHQVQKAPVKAAAPQASLAQAPQSPKSTAQSEPTKLPGKAAVVAEAPTVSTVPKVKVTFFLPFANAKHLSLSGDFNGWSPDATPMKLHDDGHWETTVDLAPGRYEYNYVGDGEWIPDLLAHDNVWNLHGTLNSVVELPA